MQNVARADSVDRNVIITPATSPQTWNGPVDSGANTSGFTGDPVCGTPKTLLNYCDVTLLNVDVAPSFWDTQGGGVQVDLTDFRDDTDVDLFIYRSDAAGNRGPRVGSSGESAGVDEHFTIPEPSGYYLIVVPYFTVVNDSYKGISTFITGRRKIPPDVDNPPGLQEFLASDPNLAYRSHSEPHIAQSPVDPNILVAGSKMYNKDPDSLAEYEFKIGTYVSFDGGVSWKDLGQLDVCPAAQAPPESWPDQNTCYPEDDPTKDGTGAEDGTRGGGGDFGEEYITSDVWIQFDDEGNAYTMVLDSPPFPSGNGWGMTLHRWQSVSATDLQPGGQTWGPRIPINFYTSPAQQELFLDDKNTFAVNNAGADGNGQTGLIIACWGQNIQPAKQQIVCERSTDGGQTWPDTPVPISDVEPLVIGVHVVADTQNPDTFYATWLQYATQSAGVATVETARTTNGGLTWTRTGLADSIRPLPRTYPGQSFRNLSIPIMAVGPSSELYITYAEYRPATNPATDEDGREGDILVVKSTDGGLTWGNPVIVTANDGPNVNADQFQPYVAVTPSGQVNVAYFDRRLDVIDGTHPGNFFTDVFLSRSNNGGQTFTDVRLTHDATDPQRNAPVSPSGLFFGDYQGLVADNCHAIPFFNDTHLANDIFDPGPTRDPDFDDGLPDSPFQEVVAWRVPNTTQFGGAGAGCGADLVITKTDAPDPAHIGQQLTYTITVTNNGPADATGVSVTDTLPKNAGFGSANTTKGTCTVKPEKRQVICTVGALANKTSVIITIMVKPSAKGLITNTAKVTAVSPDPNSGNNTASATTTVKP
ncbi:MAG TPA: hypothetical protein VGR49_04190 [Actinomycetota bacterium]|nr:hypothetical protein [Actinomycetota bacterium]